MGFEDYVNKFLSSQNAKDNGILKEIIFAMEEANRSIKEYSEVNKIDLIKFKYFSDCISLSIPDFYGKPSEAVMLSNFITTLRAYSFYFIRRDLYIRGGASEGYHYEDENIIFSDGLIKAYYLESKKLFILE